MLSSNTQMQEGRAGPGQVAGPPSPMQVVDLTLATPAENLALDEALWEAGEAGGPEVLRFWESPTPFVVVGYGNHVHAEVDLDGCERLGIPILRRVTGGGTVLQGPGCLNFALVLRIEASGPTASITGTNLHVMNRNAAALTQALGLPARRRGDTDLAIHDRKFSGNAQRRGRRALLFHGTFLLSLELEMVRLALRQPSRQPDYRQDRVHGEFMVNLGARPEVLKAALTRAWAPEPVGGPLAAGTPGASRPPVSPVFLSSWTSRARELARQKYNTRDWNFRF